MFARYTPENRRAIYFACATALDMAAPEIDSNHILRGLLVDKESRANKLFHLREVFAEDAVQQDQLKDRTIRSKVPPLNRDGKRYLALATKEADQLEDYWIDTDHFVLGILHEEACPAAQELNRVGIQMEAARQIVSDNRSSRPEMGPVPGLWRRKSGRRFASLLLRFYVLCICCLLLFIIKR